MSVLPNRSTELVFRATPEAAIRTCIFCQEGKCEYESSFFVPGRSQSAKFIGAHRACLEAVQLDWRGKPSFADDMRGYLVGKAKTVGVCGAYVGDNDGTCPELRCIRLPGHPGLHDNVHGDPPVPRGVASISFRELPDEAKGAFRATWGVCGFFAEIGLPGGGNRYTAESFEDDRRYTWLSARKRWAVCGPIEVPTEERVVRKYASHSIYGKMAQSVDPAADTERPATLKTCISTLGGACPNRARKGYAVCSEHLGAVDFAQPDYTEVELAELEGRS